MAKQLAQYGTVIRVTNDDETAYNAPARDTPEDTAIAVEVTLQTARTESCLSSHLASAESEKIVPTGHGAMADPGAVEDSPNLVIESRYPGQLADSRRCEGGNEMMRSWDFGGRYFVSYGAPVHPT